jgi:hypothetical protein
MGCEIKSTFERSISSYNSDYKFGWSKAHFIFWCLKYYQY